MRPKYKVTGCARFFVFFFFFVPAAFFGAAYFRGENGVQIIKDYYHKIVGQSTTSSPAKDTPADTYSVDDLRQQLKEAKEEIKTLKADLYEKEKEIEKLKSGGK
jgi:hypothetical protein